MDQQARARMVGHSPAIVAFSRPYRDLVMFFTGTRQFLPGYFQSRLAALKCFDHWQKQRSIACWSYSDAEAQSQKPQVKVVMDELEQVNDKVAPLLIPANGEMQETTGLGEGFENVAAERVATTRSAAFS